MPDGIADWSPALSGELAGIVADAERAIASFGRERLPALDALARLLLRTEAIASSKIEGMQVGVRELARAEARHDLGGSAGSEARSILAGVDAMQFAIDEAAGRASATTLGDLCDIHRLLMANEAPWTTPGRLRTVQNWIGGNDFNPCGADFVPPPPELVTGLMDDLMVACAGETLPVIVQCALTHAQFETIHPFNDGNGRVGRALIHVLLRRRGLASTFVPPISVVLARRRAQYISALTRFREGDPDPWIELFATAAARSAVLAARYLDDVEQLRERWRAMLAAHAPAPRSDAAAWVLLDALPARPVLTGPAAAALAGRSKPAVNQAIEQLVAAGVLEPLTRGARNRSWEPVGLVDLVTELEEAA